MAVSLDWASFERALVDALVQAVRATVTAYPDQRFYAAALVRIYRETDGRITLPSLAMNSVQALAQLPVKDQARWSAADWDHYDDEWLAEDLARDWERRLTVEACRGTTRQWEATFRRYLAMLVRVGKRARTALHTSRATDRDFVVLLLDDEYHETLIKRVLTKREVRRYFPEYDERAVELARLAALPDAERAAYYVARLAAFDGPISGEEAEAALRDLGPAALPALTPMLAVGGRAWQAAKLLADIGQPDDDVVRALHVALSRCEGPDQSWVARALARLGRLDLVLDQVDRLPQEVMVSAVAAPYTSFRNHTVAAPRLDYWPLQDVIERWPAYVPALAEELKPGRGYCDITVDDVDEAIGGLASPHAVIRRHAVCVLGERRLGAAVARRVLPLLGQAVSQDPDATVRRLAILSLLWWRKDSHRYANVVREALNDPAAEVREVAAYWLREQNDRPA
ncbi:protein of unknown function (DUF4303) [Micromonospora viridifaciens]|uniref:HEAT repeat-containing protein n=1 Tax=Micromonospora viridifaciens TaxID=1881 RepID=A0A1C4WVP6_MICVI|nr:DUF4303 domain-containing protein [Micromonospora viridifaciens]SCF00292.1 protein of unknown function (DUF4303) [Micromonospora viridifaciens]